jgi:hypothetical protein
MAKKERRGKKPSRGHLKQAVEDLIMRLLLQVPMIRSRNPDCQDLSMLQENSDKANYSPKFLNKQLRIISLLPVCF